MNPSSKNVVSQETENKYEALYQSSRDAIMTLEPPGWKFTAGNPATIAMFGAKDENDFIARAPWNYSPEFQPDGQPSSEKAKVAIMEAMEKGSNFFEWTHTRLNGKEFPATVLLTKTTFQGKDILQATVRDTTNVKNVEKELLGKVDELEKYKKATINRELKMMELKKEIEHLKNSSHT